MLAFVLTLVVVAFVATLTVLYYHVQRIEAKLADTLREVEVQLLAIYGEIPPKRVKEVGLEMDDDD